MAGKAMVGIVAAAALCVSATASAETVRFAVTDIAGLEDLQREFGAFRDALAEVTGLEIEFVPVNSRTAAVEAMRADQVEFVLTGPAEYVVFREVTDAEVVVGWQRPDYFAQIVTLSDGPYRSVEALRGETVTFGSVGSTSQHLGPAQALADLGLIYGQDYDPQIISRNVAVEALIRGDVAAVGMNFTHLGRIREAFPEVSFTVVARGRDLPNDILIVDPEVPDDVVESVRSAFVEHQDMLMDGVLAGEDNQKYLGGSFLASVADTDYDYVRSMYQTIGIDDFSQFVGD